MELAVELVFSLVVGARPRFSFITRSCIGSSIVVDRSPISLPLMLELMLEVAVALQILAGRPAARAGGGAVGSACLAFASWLRHPAAAPGVDHRWPACRRFPLFTLNIHPPAGWIGIVCFPMESSSTPEPVGEICLLPYGMIHRLLGAPREIGMAGLLPYGIISGLCGGELGRAWIWRWRIEPLGSVQPAPASSSQQQGVAPGDPAGDPLPIQGLASIQARSFERWLSASGESLFLSQVSAAAAALSGGAQSCGQEAREPSAGGWTLSALGASIRSPIVSRRIIQDRW